MNILAVNLMKDIIAINNCIKEETCDNCDANFENVSPCAPISTFVPKYLCNILDTNCTSTKCKNCVFKSLGGICDRNDYIGYITIPKSFNWAKLHLNK